MKKVFISYRPAFRVLALFIFLMVGKATSAAVDTMATGSFIINMGATNPNTVANGLKPYGLIYDLIKNHYVTVKWVISKRKKRME